MSRHRRPSPAPTVIACGAALGIVLGCGGLVGTAITADAAEAVRPAFNAPDRDDDPVRRIGPVAPIFPSDLNAPTYNPEPLPEVAAIATSSSQRACRCLPRVTPPATLTAVTSQTETPTVLTVTETPADTTAEPTAEPTEAATPQPEPDDDQPQEEPDVTDEPTEPEITDAVIEVLDPEPPDEVQP